MPMSALATPLARTHTARRYNSKQQHFMPLVSCRAEQLMQFLPLQTKAAVIEARQQLASLINADPSEVYFTSCGTESNNWALTGAVLPDSHSNGTAAAAAGGPVSAEPVSNGTHLPHVVTSSIEHPAVLVCLEALESKVG